MRKNIYKNYKKLRLKPNHNISQWYMCLKDVKKQVNFLIKNIKGSIVFLGDGDGVAILLAQECKIRPNNITQICVLDIDERELNLYKKIAAENNIKNFSAQLYNVFDILPEKTREFDNFYINPPYSSTTNPKGLGFILWLERCIELTKDNGKGIIVYPKINRNTKQWAQEVKSTISTFLEERKFNILSDNMLSHRYHELKLKSTNLLVQKTSKTSTKYKQKIISKDFAANLYHNNLPLPRYIKDNGTDMGQPVDF